MALEWTYANQAALYTLYLYLADKAPPHDKETLSSLLARLDTARTPAWTPRDHWRLNCLQQAVQNTLLSGNTRIRDPLISLGGATSCAFETPQNEVFVAFKGTGNGEWIDNGEGLSGIPEENTYIAFDETGKPLTHITVLDDYATDQQVDALNRFRQIVAKNGWERHTPLILTGHSKGGNKAQFVAAHSEVTACYSFDGQGFSPEALTALSAQYGAALASRQARLFSLSADNDYVNVLGERLPPAEHIYFLESVGGLHYLESILDDDGRLRGVCPQGALSRYIQSVSERMMRLPPAIRKHATLGVMNVFQRYLGSGTPVNGDRVSLPQTLAGLVVTLDTLLP